MLKNTLIEADKLFNKFDLETVVVYPSSDSHCCISCHTNDDLAYLYVKNKNEGYTTKEFGLRNWSSIHSIIGSLSNNENSLSIKVENDTSDYPSVFKLTNGRIKMTYFLQNYSFISNQNELLEEYKNKKFELGQLREGNADELNESYIKDISKLSALLSEKYFRIGGNVDNYIYFGDENQSIDNGKIDIGTIGGYNQWKSEMYFSVEYFVAMYRSLLDCDVKIKFTPQQIIMIGENENIIKVAILRGKNM